MLNKELEKDIKIIKDVLFDLLHEQKLKQAEATYIARRLIEMADSFKNAIDYHDLNKH